MAAKPPPVTPARKQKPKPKPRMTMILGSEIKPEALEYLEIPGLEGRFPKGRITLVGGRPKQGKSLLEAFLAAEMSKLKKNSMVSNVEDARTDTQIPRLIVAGADMRRVHFWPGKPRLPIDIEELEWQIDYLNIELLVLDPIRKHVVGNNVVAALEPLNAMAERTGCAVVAIHHVNKRAPKTHDPMDAFGGALSDYVGTARALFAFGPAGGGSDPSARFLASAGSNTGTPDTSVEFMLDGDVELDLDDGNVATPGRLVLVSDQSKVNALHVVSFNGGYGSANQAGESPEKLQVACEFLTLLLAKGPLKVNDLFDKAAEVGVSKMTMRRAAESLKVVKTRVGFGPGSHLEWSLPDDLAAKIGAVLTGTAPPSKMGLGQMDVDEVIASILGGTEGGDDDA